MASAIGTYLLEAAWAAESAAAIELATTIISYATVINTAAVVSFSLYQQARAKRAARDAFNAALRDRLVMASLTDGVRSRVYGRVRNVDGIVFKMSHGSLSQYYTFVISLAGHEVDAIETVYFNDVAVTLDGSGYVQTAPWAITSLEHDLATLVVTGGSGTVTLANAPVGTVSVTLSQAATGGARSLRVTPTVVGNVVSVSGAPADGNWLVVYQYNRVNSYARVRKYLGGPSQNLYTDLSALVGGEVNAADKFANDASLLVTLEFNQDAFPTGLPAISAVLRGAKCYDPRSATTAWTENPAIIARDWALYANGGGASAAELVDATFTAAANACDVSTTFTTATGTETRPLFQCGIACKLDADPLQVLDQIVSSMAGQRAFSGGKLAVRAGVWRAPAVTITEDWISDAQAIEIVGQTANADLVNIMRPTFADAANNYVVGPAAPVRYTAAIVADGRELPLEFDLQGTTRAVHAQHVSGVQMREAREGLTLTLPLNMRGWQLEVFDMVAVTLPEFGFSAKTFEVMGTSFSLATGPIVTLRERASAIYDPDASFDVLNLSPNTNLPDPSVVPQVTGVTVTSGTSDVLDTSILVRTTVSWTAVPSQAVQQSGAIEVQYWPAATALPAGDWLVAPPVQGNATSTVIVGLQRGVHYLFRVRARNTIGVRGKWSAQVISLQAEPPQVDTAGLAPSAATKVVSARVGGPVSATAQSGIPNNFSKWTQVASVTITPTPSDATAVEIEVTASFLFSVTGSGGATAYGAYGIQNTASFDGYLSRTPPGVPSGSTVDTPSVATQRFTVAGNVATTFGLYGNRVNLTDTVNFSAIELRAVALLR